MIIFHEVVGHQSGYYYDLAYTIVIDTVDTLRTPVSVLGRGREEEEEEEEEEFIQNRTRARRDS